ncbi:hypothetical protein HAU46_05065 [Weissella confusa]|uniref:hypothetical protein n=1 Tax=Weissella confusa TaxID=1583 RepID=UPI0018F1C0C9|nr:hypothetical protein [Weissella confusa]MBJ7647369.1 hypothetical protein [Weissella confusa]MBJ7679861.1 hypothetical protein [Weissella confusa]
MTKSGGFSIKKRHRKLGALIGLAALAVPFAANLGTLGDAIHAVTGPQNVYESELLNVKLKTSQDKTKTTWDLEFDRSQTSVSEQTVKFKLDLEKAGLKDAEIKQDDKALDMREGIVSAVLKSQSTHLILTALVLMKISTILRCRLLSWDCITKKMVRTCCQPIIVQSI